MQAGIVDVAREQHVEWAEVAYQPNIKANRASREAFRRVS